jgi:uncharacterized protein (DUF1330 family)
MNPSLVESERPLTERVCDGGPLIRIRKRRFRWCRNTPIVLSFEALSIDEGERVFIEGPSGCGDAIYDATGSIADFHKTNTRVAFAEGNVVVSAFLRFKKPNGRQDYEKFAAAFAPMLTEIGGEVVLSVRAEMPIVSEEYWDHFVAFRFPSIQAMKDLYQSGAFEEANVHRIASLEATLAVLSEPHVLPPKPKD